MYIDSVQNLEFLCNSIRSAIVNGIRYTKKRTSHSQNTLVRYVRNRNVVKNAMQIMIIWWMHFFSFVSLHFSVSLFRRCFQWYHRFEKLIIIDHAHYFDYKYVLNSDSLNILCRLQNSIYNSISWLFSSLVS